MCRSPTHLPFCKLKPFTFESKVRRHYTGHDMYNWTACAMIESHKNYRLHTEDAFEFPLGTDRWAGVRACAPQLMGPMDVWVELQLARG